MSCWNVNGITDRNFKLRKEVIKCLNQDIFCINETHLRGDETVHIDGYKWFSNNRKVHHVNAPHGFGGVGIFVKDWITDEFYITEERDFEGILGIIIKHKITHFQAAIFACYLPPENSPYAYDSVEFFRYLILQAYSYSDVDVLYFCGDFNARTGKLLDVNTDIDDVQPRNILDSVSPSGHAQALVDFVNDTK